MHSCLVLHLPRTNRNGRGDLTSCSAPFGEIKRLKQTTPRPSLRAGSATQDQIRKEKKEKKRRRYAPRKPSILAYRTQYFEPRECLANVFFNSGCEAEEVPTSRSFSSSRRIHPVHDHHPHACVCGRRSPAAASDLLGGQVPDLRSCRPRVCRLQL
jgi:hypothetical protein